MASKFMDDIRDFSREWQREYLRDLTPEKRRAIERLLSDEYTEFRIQQKKASSVYKTQKKGIYTVSRYWTEDGKLYPTWKILAEDQVRVERTQEIAIRLHKIRCEKIPPKGGDDPDLIVDESIRNAVLFMIGTINPRVKVNSKRWSQIRNNRIPTHRRNGELYMNGRSL